MCYITNLKRYEIVHPSTQVPSPHHRFPHDVDPLEDRNDRRELGVRLPRDSDPLELLDKLVPEVLDLAAGESVVVLLDVLPRPRTPLRIVTPPPDPVVAASPEGDGFLAGGESFSVVVVARDDRVLGDDTAGDFSRVRRVAVRFWTGGVESFFVVVGSSVDFLLFESVLDFRLAA